MTSCKRLSLAVIALIVIVFAGFANAGQEFECRFDSQCVYEVGCRFFEAPIPMALQINHDGDAGAIVFTDFADSFSAALSLIEAPGQARSYAFSDAAALVGVLTLYDDGTALMSRHPLSGLAGAVQFAGFCTRT
ncbi:MAG: hypothetical protein AAF626_15425 [Pseudomonadota bacterium]